MPFFGRYDDRSKHLVEMVKIRVYEDAIRGHGKYKMPEDEQRVDKTLKLVTTRILLVTPSRGETKPNDGLVHLGITPRGFFHSNPNSQGLDCFVEIDGQVKLETLIQPPPGAPADSSKMVPHKTKKSSKNKHENDEDDSEFEFMIENVALPRNESGQVQMRIIVIPRQTDNQRFRDSSSQMTFVLYFYKNKGKPPSLSVEEDLRISWSKGPRGIDLNHPKYFSSLESGYPPDHHERGGARSNAHNDPYGSTYRDQADLARGGDRDRIRDNPLDPYARSSDPRYSTPGRSLDPYGATTSSSVYPYSHSPQVAQGSSRYSPLPSSVPPSAYPAASSSAGYGRSQIDLEMENQMMRAELKRERLLRERNELRVQLQTLRGLPPSILPPSTSSSIPAGSAAYDQLRGASSTVQASAYSRNDPYGYSTAGVDREREREREIERERERERERYARDRERTRDSERQRSISGNYSSRLVDRMNPQPPSSPATYSSGERGSDPRDYHSRDGHHRHQQDIAKEQMKRDWEYSNSNLNSHSSFTRSSDPNDPVSTDSVNRITATRSWGVSQGTGSKPRESHTNHDVKMEDLEENPSRVEDQSRTGSLQHRSGQNGESFIQIKKEEIDSDDSHKVDDKVTAPGGESHSQPNITLNADPNIQPGESSNQTNSITPSLKRPNEDQEENPLASEADQENQRDSKRSKLDDEELRKERESSEILTPPREPPKETAEVTPAASSFNLTEIQKLANLLSSAKSNAKVSQDNGTGESSTHNNFSQISTISSNSDKTASSEQNAITSSLDSNQSSTSLNNATGSPAATSSSTTTILDPEKKESAVDRMRDLVFTITAKKKLEDDLKNNDDDRSSSSSGGRRRKSGDDLSRSGSRRDSSSHRKSRDEKDRHHESSREYESSREREKRKSKEREREREREQEKGKGKERDEGNQSQVDKVDDGTQVAATQNDDVEAESQL